MIKTYIITRPYHNYSFILTNKSGMKLRYQFTGGNTLTNVKASLTLQGQYAQQLLEQSEEFKSGFVMLSHKEEGGEAPVVKTPDVIVKDNITSRVELLEFVNGSLEPTTPYKQPKYALSFAEKKGYSFPNLKLNEEEE